ncbi:sigma-70 family RNA polymerase sigma factor [Chitinophaga horti]|uniref:Sigma-70 family RNA polymerase sigma factor n=1 Tax=Chitinophaga horti TaxID=2920382 RepID=A0ABY6IW61_9BACT|nr:sigma-70 family RNA polymerase sigma factor [Chitinophaga horti]UYQ91441.1 sigma-70 family RNA polymerase sigma factor [Chitinophaga horti]
MDVPGLYKRVAAGEESAFRELVELYAPRLQALAVRITGDLAVAHDLVQDTFLKVWLARDQLTELDQPSAWIKKICFFLAINYVRRQNIHGKVVNAVGQDALQTTSAAEMLEFNQLLGLVNKAVQQLPEKQQRIYRLSREQHLSINEIAEQMGLAVSTVKNLMVMALKNIRESLQRAGYPLFILVLLDILL